MEKWETEFDERWNITYPDKSWKPYGERIKQFISSLLKEKDERIKELEKEQYLHCEICNFPMTDVGYPKYLECPLCDAKDKIKELEQKISTAKQEERERVLKEIDDGIENKMLEAVDRLRGKGYQREKWDLFIPLKEVKQILSEIRK